MKNPFIKFILSVLISGGLFALALYGFDAAEGKGFSLFKFLFRLIVFGIGMTLIRMYLNKGRVKFKNHG